MGLITTGRSVIDRDLITKLSDEMINIFKKRAGQRLTIGQIRQLFMKDMNSTMTITMSEIEEAVRELENQGLCQLIERTQTVIIRNTL